MSSYLNLIGSILIGGLVFLMLNRFHTSINQTSQEKTLAANTISNAAAIVRLIEFDFNRMGLGVSSTTPIIRLADSSRITFLSDIDANGNVDSIKYVLSIPDSARHTPNPRDRILYRIMNTQSQKDAALGVTRFRIRYFDILGNITTNVNQMRTMEITLNLESIVPYDNRYATFSWQTKISPPNLKRF
ncbi:MAG: hypothetical protein ONB16_07045 [candidate division KSB1 bacterium]|nr:hypothetical protein [candidate division KSB1 bacterium]MDZ7319666.1 hypothetical protein [candidate division KSB1 bacterium]MDZ7340740.1 hypothetical protein [candidate division KSB1 bacterium]